MLIIQRPEIEAGEAEGNTPELHDLPARARLRPHARQQPAPHVAVVDPRRGRHPGALRRRAARVRRHQGCEGRRHRRHLEPQGPRAARARPTSRSRCASTSAVRPRCAPATSRPPSDVEILNPDLYIATVNAVRPPRARPHRRAGPRLPVGRAQQAHDHDRRHPGRRDLLAGAAGVVLDRADARRAGDELRQAHPRDRDRRFDHAARRARVGGRHAAQARRPGRRARPTSPAGSSSVRSRRRRRRRPTSISRSRSSTCRSGRATA